MVRNFQLLIHRIMVAMVTIVLKLQHIYENKCHIHRDLTPGSTWTIRYSKPIFLIDFFSSIFRSDHYYYTVFQEFTGVTWYSFQGTINFKTWKLRTTTIDAKIQNTWVLKIVFAEYNHFLKKKNFKTQLCTECPTNALKK